MQMQIVFMHLLEYKYLSFSPSCESLYFKGGNGKFNFQGIMSGTLKRRCRKILQSCFQ